MVDAHLPDGRARTFFGAQRDAMDHRAKLWREHASGWQQLTEDERNALASLHREAKEEGFELAEVYRQWRAGVRAQESTTSITLGEAISKCVAEKASAGRRAVYIESLSMYLSAFARGRETRMITSVTVEEIQAILDRQKSLHSRATWLQRIGTLFSWAVRRRFVARSANPCDQIEPVTPEVRPPLILTVEQSEALLRWVEESRPRSLAWVCLALLAGLRPTEAHRVTWDDIDLGRRIVTVDAAASKVSTRRLVHLLPCAAAWLERAKAVGSPLPLPPITRRRTIRSALPILGMVSWPADTLRHTCASYWLAHKPDAPYVARQLGNSPGVLLRVYHELVPREEARRWVGMRPRQD